MGRKATKGQRGDRITHRESGARGTLVDVHQEKGAPYPKYGVLPDEGERKITLWRGEECDFAPRPPKRTCQRCMEDGHVPEECPRGDCGHQLTPEGRAALAEAGYEVLATPLSIPGPPDAIFDGPVVTTLPNGTRLHLVMRHWVCTVGDVVVDGHVGTSACERCGEVLE